MEEMKRIIAENLTAMRKAHHYTQLQLAELLHYSDKAVSKWERGESLPDLFVLKQIADLYGVTLDDLVTTAAEREQRAQLRANVQAQTPPDTPATADDTSTSSEQMLRHNRGVIVALAGLLVWLLATIAFVALDIFAPNLNGAAMAFLYALPWTAIVVLVFNSIWFNRRWNYAIISVLMWSLLLSIYLSFPAHHLSQIFLVGIPAQIIIIVWSRLRPTKKS